MKRKTYYLLPLIVVAVLISACSEKKIKKTQEPGTTEVSSDLENISWMNQYTLVKDVARSGRYSSKVDSINRFSFGFSNTFAHINDTLPLNVDVSVWLYYSRKGINSSLVMSIDSAGKNVYWKGIPLKDSIKTAGNWQEIRNTFEIPKRIIPDELLKIYVWNNDKSPFFLDDMKLVFHNK